MKKEKIKNLEKKGWKVVTVSDFLHLSREEEEYIELKLALSHYFGLLSLHQLGQDHAADPYRIFEDERGDCVEALDKNYHIFIIERRKGATALTVTP